MQLLFEPEPVELNPDPHTIPPASSSHAVIHPQLAALEKARSPSVPPSVSVLRFDSLDRWSRMCPPTVLRSPCLHLRTTSSLSRAMRFQYASHYSANVCEDVEPTSD